MYHLPIRKAERHENFEAYTSNNDQRNRENHAQMGKRPVDPRLLVRADPSGEQEPEEKSTSSGVGVYSLEECNRKCEQARALVEDWRDEDGRC
ncbi:hypothetical protein MMC28_004613 [Mycoblastus sanguinarius]|nr:hypothetical protein [Mycoblastus sanguinarius]